MRRVLRSSAAFGLMLVGIACDRAPNRVDQLPPPSPCALPAAAAPHRTVDNALVFTLPDTGGILVNGESWTSGDIASRIPSVLAMRPADQRAVFVWAPRAARCADVRRIATAAHSAGGVAYDAAASGWPRSLLPPDAHHESAGRHR